MIKETPKRILSKTLRLLFDNKLAKCIFSILLMTLSFQAIYPQSKYFIKDKEGFDFILNVNCDGNTINGFTREKALLDYTSKISYQIMKAASSLKHPEIIRFNANLVNNKFEGNYDYLFTSYKIVGNINGDSIFYSVYDKNNKLCRDYKGVKVTDYTRKDYGKLAGEVIKITEDNIFDPQIIQSDKWRKFKEKLVNVAPNIADDLEFQIGFFALARGFDFTHYYIVKNATPTDIKANISLKEIDKDIAVLKIGSFFTKSENIKLALDTIQQKTYKNLIIDLRDNPGGNSEPASLIANFLTDKVLISGFFPSRKWYEEYKRRPSEKDLDKFNMTDGDNLETSSKYGFYIQTKGTGSPFKGNVYFLVNGKTGSTAECLTITAREYNLAKIVGQKTAGGLLSAKRFMIDEDIMLFVPVNDFISYKGYRVDKKGIAPDIETKKGKELEVLINRIKTSL